MAVNWNVLPWPGSLSTQIRPPISRTSVEEIVRPSPVPPNRRVVDPSAWLNASKIVACLLCGMPMPVSLTEKVQLRPIAELLVAADLHQHVSVLGELDRVADQVGDHLADPPRVADDAGRDVGGDVGNQLEPLLVREQRQRLQRVLDQLADRERNRLELELLRFDLGEVEDVVEQREQRRRPRT